MKGYTMLKNVKLQTKLLACGILLTILPLVVTSLVVLRQNGKMVKVADAESSKATYADLDHIAGTSTECATSNKNRSSKASTTP